MGQLDSLDNRAAQKALSEKALDKAHPRERQYMLYSSSSPSHDSTTHSAAESPDPSDAPDVDLAEDPDSDPDDLDPAASEDPAAANPLDFGAAVAPLHGELVNYARRLAGGDPHRASDIVQSAMVRALRRWKHFVPDPTAASVDHAVRGWMYLIVRHTFIHSYHADRRRLDRGASEAVLERAAGADLREAFSDTGDEVLEAIASLHPHHREIVELHYVEGIPHAELARRLGVSPVTVHTRLNRARACLRRTLRRYAGETGYAPPVEDERPPMARPASTAPIRRSSTPPTEARAR